MQIEEIHIRRAEPDDCVALHGIFSCDRVVAGTMQIPYPSIEAWKQRLMQKPEDGVHLLVAVVEHQVVANAGLHTFPKNPRRRHVAGIGLSVHDDWQGRGIGKALMAAIIDLAENWLNISRIQLEVYTDNLPAIRLYERCGFEREGILRQYAFRNGRYVDAYQMARLRTEPASPL